MAERGLAQDELVGTIDIKKRESVDGRSWPEVNVCVSNGGLPGLNTVAAVNVQAALPAQRGTAHSCLQHVAHGRHTLLFMLAFPCMHAYYLPC